MVDLDKITETLNEEMADAGIARLYAIKKVLDTLSETVEDNILALMQGDH